MANNVMMLESASKDLESIFQYLKQASGGEVALREIVHLENACNSLADNPERGTIPREIEKTGMFEYRQIISKPYRIIYQMAEGNVFIFGIFHGRRSIQDILKRRIIIK